MTIANADVISLGNFDSFSLHLEEGADELRGQHVCPEAVLARLDSNDGLLWQQWMTHGQTQSRGIFANFVAK